ncbi:MAG: YhfC family intramembrane metalloprotease [Lachnospiraceae bacterium]|nr:YhfC family intramembrane metalloprotease [Lachnospiraceae bacterium]
MSGGHDFLMFSLMAAALVAIFGPILLITLWRMRTRQPLKPVLIGMITFFVSAMVLENIPHVYFLKINTVTANFLTSNMLAYAAYGGIMAGLFEEMGRFVAFHFVGLARQGKRTAISYGIGHGGLECMLVAGLSYIANFVLYTAYRANMLSGMLPEDQMTQIVEGLKTLEPETICLGVFERFSALILQVALSYIVYKAVKEKKKYLLVVAILLHAGVDFGAVALAGSGISIVVLEFIIFAYCFMVAMVAFRCYKKDDGFKGTEILE